MDLIYIILSVLIRLSPAVLNLSRLSRSGKRQSSVDLAMWLPLVGWVSVSVRHIPGAFWLPWRVYDVRSLDRMSLDSDRERRLEKKSEYGRPSPPGSESPE